MSENGTVCHSFVCRESLHRSRLPVVAKPAVLQKSRKKRKSRTESRTLLPVQEGYPVPDNQ
eukprot:3486598-Rhodomonas_salina.1